MRGPVFSPVNAARQPLVNFRLYPPPGLVFKGHPHFTQTERTEAQPVASVRSQVANAAVIRLQVANTAVVCLTEGGLSCISASGNSFSRSAAGGVCDAAGG